jgi:hypothetical protein
MTVRPLAPCRFVGTTVSTKEDGNKDLLLIHSGGDAWAHFNSLSDVDQKQISAEYMDISSTPGVIGGHQLHPADTATPVRVQDGRTLTTDGPFIEMKEALGGYYLYEADNLDAAIALAARIPAARLGGAIDVRPVKER